MKAFYIILVIFMTLLASCSNEIHYGVIKETTSSPEPASVDTTATVTPILSSGYYVKGSTQVTGFTLKTANENIKLSCAIDEDPVCPPSNGLDCSSIELDTSRDQEEVKAVACNDDVMVSSIITASYNFLDFVESWETYGTKGFSESTFYAPVLKIYDNTVYVAFQDYSVSGKASVVKFNETTNAWEYIGSKGFSGGYAYDLDFDIDQNTGDLYVIYRDSSNSYKATIQKYDTTASIWKTIGNGISDAVAYNTKIKIYDSVPYVIYRDSAHSYKLTAQKFDITTKTWITIGTAGFTPSNVYYPQLTVLNHIPYVAFRDYSVSSKVSVMYFDNTTIPGKWKYLGNAGFSLGSVSNISIDHDSSDTIYVSYTDYGASNRLTLSRFNGTDWIPVPSAGGVYSSQVNYATLTISNDVPYLAFTDILYSNSVTVVKYDDNQWKIVGQAGFTSNYVNNLSMDVSGNTPFVGYSDYDISRRGTVKYLYPESPSKPTTNISEGYYQNNTELSVILSTDTPDSNIYYTLDGTTPDETANLYTGVITITGEDESITIKARAYNDLISTPSAVMTVTYTFTD